MIKRARRGTTMVELMVCVVFLASAVGAICYGIAQAQGTAANAGDRLKVLGAVLDQIENQRSVAVTSALTTGTSTSTLTNVIYTPISITRVVTLMSGYTDLYKVDVTATWGTTTLPNRNGSIHIVTYMRAPHL